MVVKGFEIARAGMGVWFIRDSNGIIWRVQQTSYTELPGIIVTEPLKRSDKKGGGDF